MQIQIQSSSPSSASSVDWSPTQLQHQNRPTLVSPWAPTSASTSNMTKPASHTRPEQSCVSHSVSQPAITIYQQQLQAWLNHIHGYLAHTYECWPLSAEYFQQVFLPSIHNRFKISIVFDNIVANTILSMLRQPKYVRFTNEQPDYYYQQQSVAIPLIDFAQETWLLLLKISQVLHTNKYISKSKYAMIQNETSAQNAVQSKIEVYCRAIYHRRRQRNSQTYSVSIKLWNQIVGIDCKAFWTKFVYMRPNSMHRSRAMKQLYGLFENYLADKFGRAGQFKLAMLIGVHQDTQNKQIVYKSASTSNSNSKSKMKQDDLLQIANSLSLFTNRQKVAKIQKQLHNFKSALLAKLTQQTEQTSYNHDATIQTYGSYRSKICLHNSDVDMVLFVRDAEGHINQSRQFICRKLWKVYRILNSYKDELSIAKLQPVIKMELTLKVPFIRVYFYGQVLKEMDVVVNNKCGLYNSRMLETYAENVQIRNVAILLKKWAKKNHLIDKTKLSSYGLTLMLLYFMMSVGLLDFVTESQLMDYKFSNKLRKNKQTADIIKDFMAFYSESSSFYHDREIACLIKGCNQHNNIINEGFVVNIHDPYDGTNPGRMKMSAKTEFFRCFENMHMELQIVRDLDDRTKKQYLGELFGFRSEEILDDEDQMDIF